MDIHPLIVFVGVFGLYLALCDLLDYAIMRIHDRERR